MKNACVLCDGIRMRATMFQRLLLKLNAIFEPAVYQMEQIVENNNTDYASYSENEKAVIAMALALVGAIKSVLDTPILTEDGCLTKESAALVEPTQKVLEKYGG